MLGGQRTPKNARLSEAGRFFRILSLVFVCVSYSVSFGQRIIHTVAGTDWVFNGDGDLATTVPLGQLRSITWAPSGELYVADSHNNIVVRVDRDQIIHVVAGNTIAGYSGDGGAAVNASLNYPSGVVVDSAGNLYISDTGNARIRKVAANGVISTIAGTGIAGFSGDNGPAVSAQLNLPQGLLLDSQGRLVVIDRTNQRIRRIDLSGNITTIAGDGTLATAGDNGPANQASLNGPNGIAYDGAGDLYITEELGHRLRKVSPAGIITTIAGQGTYGFTGDGIPAVDSKLAFPSAVIVDSTNTIYVSDPGNCRVRRIRPNGILDTYAGDGNCRFTGDDEGPALSSSLFFPHGLALDSAGNLYVADEANERVRRVSPSGLLKTYAGNGQFRRFLDGTLPLNATLDGPGGIAFDKSGNLLITNATGNNIVKSTPQGMSRIAGIGANGFTGDGGPAIDAIMSYPLAITSDAAGNIYFADNGTQRIRKISPDGVINTIAGSGVGPGYSGDGGAATSAVLNLPTGVAVDGQGNIYFSDQGNHRIRKISNGIITTFAGTGDAGFSCDNCPTAGSKLSYPAGIALDSAGNLYVADLGNERVRKITPGGTITTVAGNGNYGTSGDGGPASASPLGGPLSLAFDSAGNLYIGETYTHRVRMVTSSGAITTIAGNGQLGFSGDGGPATSAALGNPQGLAVDSNGDVYIADFTNNRIRAISLVPPAFSLSSSTLSMSASSSGARAAATTAIRVEGSLRGTAFSGLPYTTSVVGTPAPWLKLEPAAGLMPAAISAFADPTNLAPGIYQATVQVLAPGAVPPAQSFNITLTVNQPSAAKLSLDTKTLNFHFVAGSQASSSTVLLSNQGSGTVNFTPSSDSDRGWLSIAAAGGTVSPVEPESLNVTADPGNLGVGTYSGTVAVKGPAGEVVVNIPVTMTIAPSERQMLLSQTGMNFAAMVGGGKPLPQNVSIINVGAGSMDWTARATSTNGGPISWLSVSPDSGSVERPFLDSGLIKVAVDASNLQAGDYYGQVEVASQGTDNSPQYVTVILSVKEAGSTLPPEVQPAGLMFTGAAGSSPGSQDVQINVLGSETRTYTSNPLLGDGGSWLTYVPRSGTVSPGRPARMVVQPDFSSLTAGIHTGTINVQFDDLSTAEVKVLTVVAPAGTVISRDGQARLAGGCAPKQLNMLYTGSPTTSFPVGSAITIEAQIVDDCGAFLASRAGVAVAAAFSSGDPGVSLNYVGDGKWRATWQPRSSTRGAVTATITAIAAQPDRSFLTNQLDVRVTLTDPVSNTPVIAPKAVVNAASFNAPAVIAPGSLVTIFGDRLSDATQQSPSVPLGTSLATTEVRLNNQPLPLLYTSGNQINAQIPWELPVNKPLQLVVKRGDAQSLPENVTVAGAEPGIFIDPSTGLGIVVNPDGRLNSSSVPAFPGDTVVIYSSGLGPVNPAPPSGGAATGPAYTTLPVTVKLGDVSLVPLYAGLTPGYPGLYQINLTIPLNTGASNNLPLVVEVGNQSSPPATIAVR